MRDGKELVIKDTDVAPGDIIILQEGEKVPADARIIFANTLKIDEASLTGESEPVAKTDAVLPLEFVGGRPKNMVFKGTNILSGNGTAIIVATGLNTKSARLPKIATIDTEIPLKTDIANLSRLILVAVF